MILHRYVSAIAVVDRDLAVSRLVRRRLCLHPTRPMLYALHAMGLGQADLVLALLDVGTEGAREHVARIVGRPVRVLPSAYLGWSLSGRPRVKFSPKIVHVSPCPRKPGTDAEKRYEYCFREGLTLEQARARGATKRDIRRAVHREWIKLGEAA